MELLKHIENDNLKRDRKSLREVENTNKRRFEREIIMDENKRIDEIHMSFVNSRELTFEETLLAREIFEFMKSK